ncbi:MAG TPA: hypothetical protein PKC89_10945 [Pyrinomonadaceae bacterium]|nr:hypothetical protein [Pyrinomonadaceae bacterium]
MIERFKYVALPYMEHDVFEGNAAFGFQDVVLFGAPDDRFHQISIAQCVPFVITINFGCFVSRYGADCARMPTL